MQQRTLSNWQLSPSFLNDMTKWYQAPGTAIWKSISSVDHWTDLFFLDCLISDYDLSSGHCPQNIKNRQCLGSRMITVLATWLQLWPVWFQLIVVATHAPLSLSPFPVRLSICHYQMKTKCQKIITKNRKWWFQHCHRSENLWCNLKHPLNLNQDVIISKHLQST